MRQNEETTIEQQAKYATIEACAVCKYGKGAWCGKCHVQKLIKLLGGKQNDG